MALMRCSVSMLVCFVAGALFASAGAGDIELLGSDFDSVLSPGSRFLRSGMHVHECGDAVDIYVTERVPLRGGAATASRRARIGALRTLASFAHGSTGAREQDVTSTEVPSATLSSQVRPDKGLFAMKLPTNGLRVP